MHWSKLTTLEHELEAQTLLGANNSKNINICLKCIEICFGVEIARHEMWYVLLEI